ncbi:kinase-like domain-containing protein [Scheffersomyces amazonensis]|uniref:kinase-like domain-containing protein n=1 Tax=Scheffersomyces amazonensis TaxID=1078765 RepID=UPI00315D5566
MTLNILPLLDATAPISSPYVTSKQSPTNTNSILLNGFMMNGNLKFVKKIGAGTYGLIYLVQDITTGKQYAAKMLLKDPPLKHASPKDAGENKKYIQRKIFEYFATHPRAIANEIDLNLIKNDGLHCPFLREIALHLKVHQHPNIITIHKVLNLDNLAIIILMDYFEQGDLFNNIIDNEIFQRHQPQHLKQVLMKNVMLQLIEALEYCDQNGIYHCDLKPENIMINYNPNYKRKSTSPIVDYNEIHIVLIDFGLAMDSNLICCNACRGSSFYMAPERTTNYNTNNIIRSLIDMKQYHSIEINNTTVTASNSKFLPTLAGDIWSLGVLFINISCSRNPWPIASFKDQQNNNDVFKSYMLNNNKNILGSILPISHQFNRLLDKIFQLNPNDRISLSNLYKEIIRCDFFSDQPHPQHTHSRSSIKKANHQDEVVSNPQLNTPPDTHTTNSFIDVEEEEDQCESESEYSEEEDMEEEIREYHSAREHHSYENNNNKRVSKPVFHMATPANSIEEYNNKKNIIFTYN